MRIALALALSLLTLAGTAQAQLPYEIHAGVRVRLTLRGDGQEERHTGTIIQVRGDSLVMREENALTVFAFASRNVATMDISQGRPFSPWSAMKWGAIGGAAIGASVAFSRYHDDECEPPTTACRNGDMAVGGLQGAAAGAAVGYVASLFNGERWKPVIVGGRTVSQLGIRLDHINR